MSSSSSTHVLTIRARPPREGAASHLVVVLHGVGSDAASFEPLARALSQSLPLVEVVVPDGFHPFDGGATGRQWFSVRGVTEENRPARVREAGAEVSRWIDAELATRGLRGDRVVVVGFSQGATVSAWLALHRQPSPAAVVMLSGRVAEDAPPTSGSVTTPVFMGHGDRDAVIPPSVVEPGAKTLEASGARVTARMYRGLGHQIDGAELRDARAFLERTLVQP